MKASICEMCGSQELVEQNGMFVCQSCGTKYSPNDTKKLLMEVDISEKLDNYYILARCARETDNIPDAKKYYDLIRQEAPNDWEAYFFSSYYSVYDSMITELASATLPLKNCIPSVFQLIKDTITDDDERQKAVGEVCYYSFHISEDLEEMNNKWYDGLDPSNKSKYHNTHYDNIVAYNQIQMEVCGKLCDYFADDNFALSAGIPILKRRALMCCIDSNRYVQYIRRFEPGFSTDAAWKEVQDKITADFIKQQQQKRQQQAKSASSGCYVATAVYGSYDCPQVWTLRRYRDYTLAETWYGRVFICIYYAISPILVKRFGKTNWFQRIWKPKLDHLVSRLNQEGVENTPYTDKEWL